MVVYAPAEPDVIGGLIVHLRAALPIAALVNTLGTQRVSAALSKRWAMPDYAIVMHSAGGPGGIEGTTLDRARVDFLCYGPGNTYDTRARTATDLYRTLKAVLCPPVGMGIPRSFRVNAMGLMVWDVNQSGKYMVNAEPETDWARNVSSFIFLYGQIPYVTV